ncbi:MAG: hypothetical protein KA035_00195 [Candidatus Levybacteria bacterium]|nr:hypothetical protein [Candidatus Levybacteria bacterium]
MPTPEAGPQSHLLSQRREARVGARQSWHNDPEMRFEAQAQIPFLHEVLPIDQLLERKSEQGLKVHLVIPTLNEGTNPQTGLSSVGKTIDRLEGLRRVGLVDNVTVYDSSSVDDTEAVVRARGVDFQRTSDILEQHGMDGIRGKGANLWASVLAHHNPTDLLIFADADFNAKPSQIQAIVSPLIEDEAVQLSLSIFERKTRQGIKGADAPSVQGGRVTELLWKPLVGAYFPEVNGLIQPIAGLYAGRGSSLAESYFPTDYRVETALVIDALMKYGEPGVSQVYCGIKDQEGQTIDNLGKMATQITHESMSKAQQYGRGFLQEGLLQPSRRLVQHPIHRNGHAVIGENTYDLQFVNLPAPADLLRSN